MEGDDCLLARDAGRRQQLDKKQDQYPGVAGWSFYSDCHLHIAYKAVLEKSRCPYVRLSIGRINARFQETRVCGTPQAAIAGLVADTRKCEVLLSTFTHAPWAFELTPEGVKREKDIDRAKTMMRQTGRKLDFIIIAVLAIAVVFFVFDKFF